ncbi:hypothetical protein [Desulfosporosinus sp. BG]|uniref:hypothetical protein n=1 Tax=Desulfosporosinus sp. BG TaxID=1633135 RepID=UPI00083AAD5E|nr:hypothetical protein [Desulfosporosinus sp. BG]ODA39219.1 hypothetical protein DSBG_4016 [Desulfosporosinus sp. BG]
MPAKRWSDFFLYLGRVFILLILLAVLLPKLMAVCNIWMSSFLHNEQKPIGNPLRVEAPGWGKFVFQWFPPVHKER